MTRLDRRQRTTDGRGSLRATVGAASRPRSTYCSLADDKIQADMFYQPAEVRDMVEGPDASVLEAVDTLVFEMAGRVADDATTERARHRDDAHGRPR